MEQKQITTTTVKVGSDEINIALIGNPSDFLKNTPTVYRIEFENGKLYIGSTSRLSGRIEDHIKNISRGNTPVARTLVGCKSIKVFCLEKCDSQAEAKVKERAIIHEQAKIIYNSHTKKKTNYRSYNKYKDIVNTVLLNKNSL